MILRYGMESLRRALAIECMFHTHQKQVIDTYSMEDHRMDERQTNKFLILNHHVRRAFRYGTLFESKRLFDENDDLLHFNSTTSPSLYHNFHRCPVVAENVLVPESESARHVGIRHHLPQAI